MPSDYCMIPKRRYGIQHEYLKKKGSVRLPLKVPIIGLGCSSFSNFFSAEEANPVTLPVDPKNPRVREWINTIREAIDCGINLLDTAPWYGHGISECVIGLALTFKDNKDELNSSECPLSTLKDINFARDDIIINTKVGRYESDPQRMFDFSAKRMRSSVILSIERMKCKYINVIQLHDPEFSPSLELLVDHCVPALCKLRQEGFVRAIGLTGYPLEIQHQILVKCGDKGMDFDQSLSYCHFNLHDESLFTNKISYDNETISFFDFCMRRGICVMAAAPLSMGLFTKKGPPNWHPASQALRDACKDASVICMNHDVNIEELALLFALSKREIPCTLIGIRNRSELTKAVRIAERFSSVTDKDSDLMQSMLSVNERIAFNMIRKNDSLLSCLQPLEREWNGCAIADAFWNDLGTRDKAEHRMRIS